MIRPGDEPEFCKKMLHDLFGLSEYEADITVEKIINHTGCQGMPLVVAICNAMGIEPVEVIGEQP